MPRIRLDQRPENFFEDIEVKDFKLPSSLAALEQKDAARHGFLSSAANNGSDSSNADSETVAHESRKRQKLGDTGTGTGTISGHSLSASGAGVGAVAQQRDAESLAASRHRMSPPRWVGELYLEVCATNGTFVAFCS
jgi:hypothetical protein